MKLYQVKRFIRNYYLALASFLLILLVTIFFYQETKSRIRERDQLYFNTRTAEAQFAIERRITHYFQILKGAKGLFEASDTVTRSDWKKYISTLEVDKNYPGIQGIGYSVFVKPEELDAHLAKIRAEGFQDYNITPEGTREIYSSIIYLEPFKGRNLKAFGYDMYSEPVRRKAMEIARDSNTAAITGKVTLVQETDKDVQAGFLMYFPVYKKGTSSTTLQDRRNNILGYVYNPFRAGDMMNATLQRQFPKLQIQVFDSSEIKKENLLYQKESIRSYFDVPQKGEFRKTVMIEIGQRNWKIYFASMPDFGESGSSTLPALILIGGTLINLLISFVIWSLSKSRQSALIKQTITDNASAALFIVDDKGYCTFMNPAASVLTGYSFEEIRKKPLRELIHNNSSVSIPFSLPKSALPGIHHEQAYAHAYEDRFYRKDGSNFEASCSARPLVDINAPGSVLIELRDITKIKEAAQVIAENSALLQKIFMEAPAIVGLIKGPERIYDLVNPQLSQLFGNRELAGKTIRQAHPELEDQRFFEVVERAFTTGETLVGKEVQVLTDRNNDGNLEEGFFNIVYQPIFNQHKQVDAVLLFAVEVTELVRSRKKMLDINKELSSKNKKLVQTNNDLDNFVYTASHDLKAPIANLEGLATLLKRRLDPQTKMAEKQILDLVDQSINKLKQTISDLTEITKVQKDLQENVEPLQFEEILEDIKADIYGLISESGVIIEHDFKVSHMSYARKNLRSIMYNLVSNAIKYRDASRQALVNIRTFEENGKVVLQISDNGLGIKQEQKHKLFSMFKRLHTHVEGTGIGLYIVKRIIENNGGRIDVDSTLGQGTTFTVYFNTDEE